MRETASGHTLREEQDRLACMSALTSPVTHEFNNFLNLVLLQVAVLQQQMPEASGFREELASIRRQGKSLAALIQQWQQYRQRCQSAPVPIDLNAVIEQETERLSGACPQGVRLQVKLAPALPRVIGSEQDARVVLCFLVSNALAALGGAAGTVTIRTVREPEGVLLAVEDTGPVPESDKWPQLLDPQAPARLGTNGLELSACETLVRRRFQGRMEGVALSEGGLSIQIRMRPCEQ